MEEIQLFQESLLCSEELADFTIQAIIEKGGALLYNHYIESKVTPYTLDKFTAFILGACEMETPRIDFSDENYWGESVEPKNCEIDTWARSTLSIKQKIKHVAKIMPQQEKEPSIQSKQSKASKTSTFRKTGMSKAKKASEKTGQMEALEEIEIELPDTAQSGQETEEEPLRQRLEKEMKKIKDDEQKIKNRQKEEEERKMKLQKIQQELKQKDYTFDHNGTIIYSQKLNVDKLVPDKYQMKYVFSDGFNQESTLGTLSRLGRDFSKSKTKILPPIEQQRSQKQSSSVKPSQEKLAKKTPKQEKDFVQKVTKSQSSTFTKEDINIQIFDNIKLASGVNLKESNKSKKGVEPPKSNRITLTEYKKLVEQNLSVPENKQLISAINDTTSFEKEKGTRKFASARNL